MSEHGRQIIEAVEAARGAIAAGHFIDLAGLDLEIAALCTEAMELPMDQRNAAAEELSRLRRELDTLAGAIEAQHSAVQGGDEARLRASGAYRRQAGGEPPPAADRQD